MRIKKLSQVKRIPPLEIPMGTLPGVVRMTRYARDKAFRLNRLIRETFGGSYEWYGFTLGRRDRPEVIRDIGLPRNAANQEQYTRIEGRDIVDFHDQLPEGVVVNGWIHSHGDLAYHNFSPVDEANHRVVLEFVSTRLRRPVFKREVRVEDWNLVVEGAWGPDDILPGSVSLITDVPVRKVRILETHYGSFCFAVVVGDGGWMVQEVLTKTRGILTGATRYDSKAAELVLEDDGETLDAADEELLREEVKRKVRPPESDPPNPLEKM